MKLPRRRFLHLSAAAAALPALSQIAKAEAYPTRSVRIIVGFPAGNGGDIAARIMGQWLAERLGQPFVVENRPGAGGNIGTEIVARAPPDGYTLLLIVAANAINATLYDKLSFNFTRDIAAVASLVRTQLVMAVVPSFPAKTVAEFIAYAKANPGKINMATNGIGTIQHVSGELFNTMAGVDLVPVHFHGDGPALNALIGGEVQVMFETLPPSIGFIRAGTLRAIGVTTAARLDILPDVPPVGDFVPGYEASGWVGIGAPKNTPAEIIDKLNTAVNAGLADPTLKERLAGLGTTVFAGSPAEFEKLIVQDADKWARVIRTANIKAE